MDDTWHDNRPCDRLDPAFLKVGVGGGFMVATTVSVLNYYIVARWAGGAFALAFAFAFGAISLLPLVIVASTGSRFPSSIRFDPTSMTWRAKGGKVYTFEYSSILLIIPSRWKGDFSDGTCKRYFVYLPGRTPISRWMIAITPENRDRLEVASRGVPIGQPISPPGTREPHLPSR